MTDFDGNITSPNRRQRNIMDNNTNDIDYELSSIITNVWDAAIDASIGSAFVSDLTLADTFDVDTELSTLASALTLKAEISKFSVSIGTCTVQDENTGDDIVESGLHTLLDELEEAFSKDLPNLSNISSTSASPSNGIDPKLLSKLWCINEY